MKTASSVAEPTRRKTDPGIDAEERHVPPIRDHAERQDRRHRHHDRREEMHHLVGARGHDVFLDQHLDAIRGRLKQPECPDAVRPEPVLNARENLSLEQRHEREERQENDQHRRDADETGDDLREPLRRAGKPGENPMLRGDEDLVEGLAHLR
jgi:hypothetical protein